MDGRVVVVGAGVIGLSCAWRLADRGVEVVLLDPEPARGASWAAAGMLAPVTELHYGEEPLLALNLAAQARWPDHVAALGEAGHDVGYAECGSLMVARDADDAAELRRLEATQRELGMAVRWLRSREMRAVEPALAPTVRGGILVEGDHRVDNRALVEALLAICRRHTRIRVEALAATRLQVAGGQVRGVEVADGDPVAADAVVVAAGARSGALLRPVLGAELPIRPVKGQLLHLRAPDGPVASHNLRGEDCYIVNRADGRIVVGATMEEQGFDDRPTAGAVGDLLRAAWELLPATAEATFVDVAVGFRPATPDNSPWIGPVEGVDGLVLATGHFRNGVLQSPLTAEAVTSLLVDGALPASVAGFVPARSGLVAA